MNINFLNKWFDELEHHNKVILMAGYKYYYNMPYDEYSEMDDSDDNFIFLWNKNNEFEKLDLYCNYLDIDIKTITIDDNEKFYFLPYDDKVKYLKLDDNLMWENDRLNSLFKQKKTLG